MTSAPDVATAVRASRVVRLELRDFRNISHARLDFPEAGVALIGDNGQGKTNLLEALRYLGLLRSFRGARDRDVVRHGATAFHVAGETECVDAAVDPRAIGIGFERVSGRKRVTVDGVHRPRQSEALGILPSVVWSPQDVALIAGGPGERRYFLDVALALSSLPYLRALRSYRGALERRNAALRTPRGSPGDAAAWEPLLAEHGAQVVRLRRAWASEHASAFATLCARTGERAAATLRWSGDLGDVADADLGAALATALHDARGRDAQRGLTSVGPHRDDLVVTLDDRDARTFGSAGQQRTAAIALRLLEARTLRDAGGAQPVLLFDDPFAELDARRTACTLDVLASEAPGQVVLAVPRASEIPAHFRSLAQWRVVGGEIRA